ncbi:hypothetical protein JCM33374_g3143 [Metschnikowia sp. JCM 33374]|nr:hypothetical protein JCM33374_g3143 [Metschnikowia sp. JCM 33374]
MALALKYWLGMQFDIMVKIPPQIFGFIAFSCLGVLNLASLRFVRNFAFDFFLAQHRFFNFVMTLLAYFHNGGNHAAVILGVHLLVVDRIVGRVIGILHKRKGPTKGRCDFEILDDSTVRVSIPISIRKNNGKWYWCFVPRYGSWRAGQHVLFNCNKVALLAYHPFTISSLPDSGKMVLVIKVQKGFTKQLHKRLNKMAAEEDPESSVETTTGVNPEVCDSFTESIRSTDQLKTCSQEKEVDILAKSVESFQNLISSFQSPRIFNIKAGINGPFGANYQPLTKFDSVVFFSAGSGASFTLPVALDLLKTLQQRDGLDDYLYRPKHAQITLVFSIKYLANLQWYDHLWKEFIPFFNSGRARLCLHVTQEGSQAQDVLEIQEVSEGQEVSGLSEDEQYLKKEKFEVTREFSTVSREGNSTSSDSVLDTAKCGFSLSYGRPDIESIVTTSVGKVCSPTYRKAFACISCGPRAFNSRVKKACERNRWVPNAPDVYCYQESFG